jgi:cob(I)alamin adenosyltransferase
MRASDEPVRLTKIYTRGGDGGQTSLGDGSRVSKLDPRIAAYGAVDELNAHLGSLEPPADQLSMLRRIQNELFDLGADLSVPYDEGDERLRIVQGQVHELERLCDTWNEGLPELKSFVLPGGNPLASRYHVARTVCRRAELEALRAAQVHALNPLAVVYLNRLSDLLFILSRVAAGGDEVLWRPGSSR